MKVLFVDDETRILSGIENALLFDYDDWEVEFCDSGQAAIDRLDATDFDVLVTDMQMPILTGADVLEHATNLHPDTVRIVLSGEVSEQLAQRAMPLTHEFVSKPCEPSMLFGTIERVFDSSRALTSTSGVGVLSVLHKLPTQVDLQRRVQAAFESQITTKAFAQIVEKDLSITTSIIRTANSAFYGRRQPVQQVADAVSLIGEKTLSGLLSQAGLCTITSPAVSEAVAKLNARAARRSHVVSCLVSEDPGYAAQAGLLCDIGILALLALFPQNTDDLEEAFCGVRGTPERERVLFGATHAEIGAAMLDMWNFSPTVIEAVRCHHEHGKSEGASQRISEAIMATDLAAGIAAGDTTDIPTGFDEALLARAVELWEKAGQQ